MALTDLKNLEERMRRGFVVAVVLLAVVATAEPRKAPTLDDPIDEFSVASPLSGCGLATVVSRLQQAGKLLIGFERTQECAQDPNWFPDASGSSVENLSGLTGRQILDRLVTLAPDVEWRDMNGVAVIRSASAWSDTNNPLNMQSNPFTIPEGILSESIAAVFRMPVVKRAPDPALMVNQSFQVSFPGGTVLEALNEVIRAHGAAGWYVGWLPAALADGSSEFPNADIMVRTLDTSGFSVGGATTLPHSPK
jgi:hypothetical protein